MQEPQSNPCMQKMTTSRSAFVGDDNTTSVFPSCIYNIRRPRQDVLARVQYLGRRMKEVNYINGVPQRKTLPVIIIYPFPVIKISKNLREYPTRGLAHTKDEMNVSSPGY